MRRSHAFGMPTPDFGTHDHGTIFVIRPLTDAAHDWVALHLPADAPRWSGGIAIEANHVASVLHGIEADGLIIP